MKELSDKKFDELLKQKAESVDFDFDQSAWDKMEQKLRRRDRIIFIRNSSFVLLLLLLCGGTYMLLNKNSLNNSNNQIAEESKTAPSEIQTEISKQSENNPKADAKGDQAAATELSSNSEGKVKEEIASVEEKSQNESSFQKHTTTEPLIPLIADSSEFISYAQLDRLTPSDSHFPAPDTNLVIVSALLNDTIKVSTEINKSSKRKLSLSVTAVAGPDFSSVESLAGKKGNLNVGLLVNTRISKNITISSGVKYGIKNYVANAYDYNLQYPSRAAMISGIDASCNILEIPLQISYFLFHQRNTSIQVSSGLSSYLMLKEEYNFKYTPQSGYKDYLLIKNNANQHYLSVLSLAASYHIKPRSSNIQWAIEPYVKLPLSGVGEGNVRLKSSGVSLNLTYDISKKNK